MNQYNATLTPDDPEHMPPARRRRARRLLAPLEPNERTAFIDVIAHRASPSFDFFLFSLIAAVVIAGGFILDSSALLLLGALLAPRMAPAVGMALGTVLGSGDFSSRAMSLLVGGLLVFGTGYLAGFAARPGFHYLTQAHFIAQLSWWNFLVLAVGPRLPAFSWYVRSRVLRCPVWRWLTNFTCRCRLPGSVWGLANLSYSRMAW
jgi:hypothetical protein